MHIIAGKCCCLIPATHKKIKREETMHKGNLLTLLPPYFFTCVIESCERWMFLYLSLWCVQPRNCIYDCVFLVVQKNVWLSVMFVKRNKSHKMDHNCKTLYVFRGKLYCFSVGEKKEKKLLCGKYKDARLGGGQ